MPQYWHRLCCADRGYAATSGPWKRTQGERKRAREEREKQRERDRGHHVSAHVTTQDWRSVLLAVKEVADESEVPDPRP
eukprot:3107174-Rhodomonas_salina.6